MGYLSVSEAALQMGVSVRRIQQMCKSGEIPGAIKKGRSWMIPTGEEKDTPAKAKKLLPIGISDFRMAGIGTSRVISFNLVSGMIMEMAANSSTLAWKIP